jgi:hypothetical protein
MTQKRPAGGIFRSSSIRRLGWSKLRQRSPYAKPGSLCRFDCCGCGVNTFRVREYYLLRPELWDRVVPPERRTGMLCVGCFERRLGRTLVMGDFGDGIMNSLMWIVGSPRLRHRMGARCSVFIRPRLKSLRGTIFR